MNATMLRPISTRFDPALRGSDARLAELVIALSGCPARDALELVRRDSTQSPLSRVAFALVSLRARK